MRRPPRQPERKARREKPRECHRDSQPPVRPGQLEGTREIDVHLRVLRIAVGADEQLPVPDGQGFDLVRRSKLLRAEPGQRVSGTVDNPRPAKGHPEVAVDRLESQRPEPAPGKGEPQPPGMAGDDRLNLRVAVVDAPAHVIVERRKSRLVGLHVHLKRARTAPGSRPGLERNRARQGKNQARSDGRQPHSWRRPCAASRRARAGCESCGD